MRRRGQLVLLAAVALAIALVPMTLAHLQLGYHEDVESVTVDDNTLSETVRILNRALDDASAAVPAQYEWSDRDSAIQAVRDRLRPTLETLNSSQVSSGTVILITYNQSRASAMAANNCPGGTNRDFGVCEADSGIVVQNRTSQTHVLSAAFDVRITTPQGDWQTISVVRTNERPTR